MFTFPGLMMTSTSEESKALNMDLTPKVIISASGMCDAGRIRHHLKHNLWRSECTICFVGYQAQGSLGARLLDGVDKVRLFGEEIAVHARIVKFEGMSSHADLSSLLEWVGAFAPRPEHVFVVHGDADVAPVFAQNLKDRGYSVHAPEYTEVYDLAANRVLSPAIRRSGKRRFLWIKALLHTRDWRVWACCCRRSSVTTRAAPTRIWASLPIRSGR